MTTKKDIIKKIKKRKIDDKSNCLVECVSRYSKRPKQAAATLFTKLKNMISSTKSREIKLGRESHLSIGQLIELAKRIVGTECIYCKEIITHNNISIDHIVSIFHKGESKIDNIQFICASCNRRKSVMSHDSYVKLIELLNTLPKEDSSYIKAKLTMVSR